MNRNTFFLFSLNCYWFNFSVSFRFRKRSMEVCPRFIWECHIWGTRWQYLRCRGAPLVSAAVFWTGRVSWTGDSELNEMTGLSRKLHSALPFKMHLYVALFPYRCSFDCSALHIHLVARASEVVGRPVVVPLTFWALPSRHLSFQFCACVCVFPLFCLVRKLETNSSLPLAWLTGKCRWSTLFNCVIVNRAVSFCF